MIKNTKKPIIEKNNSEALSIKSSALLTFTFLFENAK